MVGREIAVATAGPTAYTKRAAHGAALCFDLMGPRVSRAPASGQFNTKVLMRLGTSPTGTTALIFMLAVSMAVTDRSPELEM